MTRLYGLLLLLTVTGCPSGNGDTSDAGLAPVDAGSAPATDAGVGGCPADCPTQHCLAQRCIEMPAPECAADGDCLAGQRCSVSGVCFAGACQSHGDCSMQERCHLGRCLPRVSNAANIQFERLRIPALEAHQTTPPSGMNIGPGTPFTGGTGFGMVLLDYDGDFDLDLFVGSEGGVRPCLYRNDSRPAEPRLVPDEAHCDPSGQFWHGGYGLDLEGDGYHELVRFGPGRIELQRFHPLPATRDLLALLPPEDERRLCNPGSAMSLDFDYDGRADLLIGCQFDMASSQERVFKNLLFLQGNDGQLHFVDQEAWERGEDGVLLRLESSTLALGAADLNDDGLQDLIVSEDVLVSIVLDDPDPGGIYYACAPHENCRFEVQRFGTGTKTEGAFMGSAVLRLGDHAAHHLYVTDMGDNRLLRRTDNGLRDMARLANARVGFLGETPLYGWGVVIDDFDRDGRDDILVGNGAVPDHDIPSFGVHLDMLLLQKTDGIFGWYSGDVGIDPFTTQDSGHAERTFASRGLLKSDLDRDGYLEILAAGMEGAPRTHREVPLAGNDAKRCTLIPFPRYVPGHGVGHALISPTDPRTRHWDSQGQVRSGASPHILTPWATGTLVFPSGARVPYDCTDARAPVLIIEPEWLRLSGDEDTLWIETTPDAPPGDLSVLPEGGGLTPATRDDDGRWRLDRPANTTRVMLQFGQRFTARWWPLP